MMTLNNNDKSNWRQVTDDRMAQGYDSYAPIYDATGQERFSMQSAEWAQGWLRECGAAPAHVLDLACGAGGAALTFASSGCHVVGVDRSAAMLAIAEGKARGAGADVTFVQADIRCLTIDERPKTNDACKSPNPSSFVLRPSSFVLATCFDALNELPADGDLQQAFAGVAAALRPGGWFVFDMLAEDALTADERDVIICNNTSCVVYHRFSYDEETGKTRRRVVWLVREIDRWWRGEETHMLRAWSSDDMQAALAAAGLRLVERTTCGEHIVYVAKHR